MSQAWVLGQRALREGWRTPEALLPTLFIPLFFLVVNVGQAAKIFPSASTGFLHGQGYGAFQLPSSLLLAGDTMAFAEHAVEHGLLAVTFARRTGRAGAGLPAGSLPGAGAYPQRAAGRVLWLQSVLSRR